MSECQRCGGRANDAFLCRNCIATTRRNLGELPWWQHRLTEAALGQTCMSDNGGRKSARRKDLDGDASVASCIEQLPADDDLDKARSAREKAALRHALAAGGINARASELLAEIADGLGYWCRVLCEARGLSYVPPVIATRPTAYGEHHAIWLLGNVSAIAASEDADTIAGEISSWLDEIARVVNRPVRWWALGACPGWLDAAPDREAGECAAELRVMEGTEEVVCRDCKTRHDVHRLLLSRKYEADGRPMTWRQMRRYNRELPPEFQAPMRTLEHWLKTGKLASCGGDADGDLLYSWVDVRLLLRAKPQMRVTGAAARMGG